MTPTADGLADDWIAAVVTTLGLMLASAAIAGVGGILSAWAASTLRDGRRWILVRVWLAAMLTTLALPLILHAAAWEATAGKFGWLMQTTTGGNLVWVAWIHGCHGVAIVALATFWSTRRVDAATIDHARLDHGPAGVWWTVRVPIAWPAIGAAMLAVMLLAATEMSVADLHSVRTIADQFYLFHAADPSTTAVMMTLVMPIVLGAPLLWLRCRVTPHCVAAPVDVSPPRRTSSASASGLRLAGLAVGASIALVVALPMLGLAFKAGHTVAIENGQRRVAWSIAQAFRSIAEAPTMFASEYAWTCMLAFWTTVLMLPVVWLLAWWARSSPRRAMVFDAMAIGLFLVPGPIVGLFWTWVFSGANATLTMLATRTLVPTMLAVGLRGGVVAYAIIRLGFDSIPVETARHAMLDGNRWWRIRFVDGPMTLSHVVVAAVAMMIVSSGDVPAMLPVVPPGVTTVGTRLFGLLHSGARYQEASLAFWYLIGILAIAMAGQAIARRRHASSQSR